MIEPTVNVDALDPFEDLVARRYEDEGLFSRDLDDHLVRVDEVTAADLTKKVTVTIDGHKIEIEKARTATDAAGKPITDENGKPVLRATTIYDAANELFVMGRKQPNPIPILCHQDHMRPVAVCRICAVQISRIVRGSMRTERRLLPACQHRVEDGMVVRTMNADKAKVTSTGPEREKEQAENNKAAATIRKSVRMLTEMLSADHLNRPEEDTLDQKRPLPIVAADEPPPKPNELQKLVERMKSGARPTSTFLANPMFNAAQAAGMRVGPRTVSMADGGRPVSMAGGRPVSFATRPVSRVGGWEVGFTPNPEDRGKDDSSFVIAVDHSKCILCDRCVRGCSEVKNNQVISRAGKGYKARIAFDLDDEMGKSTCVSCGECASSCPTGALTFRKREGYNPFAEQRPAPQIVPASELAVNPFFKGLSYEFLKFTEGSVARRKVKKGDVLCREGEYGASAFLLLSGRYEVTIEASMSHTRNKPAGGILGMLGKITPWLSSQSQNNQDDPEAGYIRNEGSAPFDRRGQKPVAVMGPEDVIVGEMACLNNYPRGATVTAIEDGDVLEILKNVLYVLQRNPLFRRQLDALYKQKALRTAIQKMPLFRGLGPGQLDECIDFLKSRLTLLKVEPGQNIFRQGESADAFYLVRLGFVKVNQRYYGQDIVLNYLGPGDHFGEVGLLSSISDLPYEGRPIREHIAERLAQGLQAGKRTASCSALDHVELVRIKFADFRDLLEKFPAVRDALVRHAMELLEAEVRARENLQNTLDDFVNNGLYGANSLLLLDLEKCTRCDECSKACADTHEGVTRLVREGLRFDKWLVATSCRSCMDPYCLVGCPVGSIRRTKTKEIRIENWCVGCGLCSNNCPYGNIRMVTQDEWVKDERQGGRKVKAAVTKATTCDLCVDIVGSGPNAAKTSCVYACPHDAAHRMTGLQLKTLTEQRAAGEK